MLCGKFIMSGHHTSCARTASTQPPTPPPSPPAQLLGRYQDEVRKVLKQSWEAAWNLLEEHRDALGAGVQALIQRKELLGPEVREIFDRYPGVPVDRPYVHPMPIFTEGEGKQWPFGAEWLPDAYPTPYWVRKERREREAAGAEGGKELAGVFGAGVE